LAGVTHAAEPAKKPFDLPAGAAELALRQFARQSGLEVIYPAEIARGLRTPAVKGQLVPREALEQLLAGAGLIVMENGQTGAFTLSRQGDPRDRLAGPTTPIAHPSAPANKIDRGPGGNLATRGKEAAVVLQPFAVTMTQDKGYHVTNSGSALKTREDIMKIPQSVTVITRDLIDDVGSNNLSDVLSYAGIGNFFQGDTATVRGSRVNLLTDGSVDGQAQGPSVDISMIDSIMIVLGPAAVLYGLQASLTGMVQKNTRAPLFQSSGTLTLRTDQFGLFRSEIDQTGPMGSLGDSRFAYRLVLAHQDGKSFFKRSDNDRDVAYLAMELERPQTSVRINGSYQLTDMIPHRNIFITPEGVPYAGAGRNEDYIAPGMHVKRTDQNLRAQVQRQLAPGWDLQARGTLNRNAYSQSVMLGSLVDYRNNEVSFISRWNRLSQRIAVEDLAVHGSYTLFKRKAGSFFGMVHTDSTANPLFFPVDPSFGNDNAARGIGRASLAGTLVVPMDRPMIDAIVVRKTSDYPGILDTPGTRGINTTTRTTTVFYEQKIELIPDRLTLTGSLSGFNFFIETEDNLTVPPPPVFTPRSEQSYNDLFHRVGVVANVTKDIVLYALETTTMMVQAARLIDGSAAPTQQGKMREVGLKTDVAGDRLSTTLGAYAITLTRVGFNPGTLSPITGGNYVILIGKVVTKGADFSLTARPLANWQLTGSFDWHTVKDAWGHGQMPLTDSGSWSFFTRYDFSSGWLKPFAIGGGANRFFDRYIPAGNLRLRDGSTPPTNGSPGATNVLKLKDGTMATLFIDYRVSKKLTLKLTVNNVFDQFFAIGYQSAVAIDPSLPRNFQFAAIYKF